MAELFPELQSYPMDYFERRALVSGFSAVAGVDEAGRGPLAGPVVAAAVMFPPNLMVEGVNDSKQLSAKERERLFPEILRVADCIGVGHVSAREIDRINIFQASRKAMQLAVSKLSPPPDFLLIDGIASLDLSISQLTLKKGDQRSHSIAAASIVAKVTRDRIMARYHQRFPQYHFLSNKGYGTAAHKMAIESYGACPIHRRTFRGVTIP